MLYRNGVPVRIRPWVQRNGKNRATPTGGFLAIRKQHPRAKATAIPPFNDRAFSRELKTLCVMMNDVRFNKYYKSGPHFRIENPNPEWAKKRGFVWDRGDCVIRALANAISCSWVESFDYLTAKARRDFNVPNDGPGFRRWIQEDGAVWTHCKAEKGKKRMTALQFAETHPTGRYVLSVANHETACVDGVILDAWNCGGKCVVGYFDMSAFKLN